MAVTFVSKEKQAPKKSVKAEDETAKKVERMAKLKKMIDDFKAVTVEYDELRKGLMEAIPADAQDNKEVVFEGTKHKLVFSARAKVRTILDVNKVRELMGNDTFFKVAKVTLTDIDKYLSEGEKNVVVVEAQNGSRTASIKEL